MPTRRKRFDATRIKISITGINKLKESRFYFSCSIIKIIAKVCIESFEKVIISGGKVWGIWGMRQNLDP